LLQALKMIHNIRDAFNELLEANKWMDADTKSVAKEKVIYYVHYLGDI
jgi:predicted metalloendopeptidase